MIRLLGAIGLAGLVVFAAFQLLGGEDAPRIEPPELGGALVEYADFDRCVRDAPAPADEWKLSGPFVLGGKAPRRAGAGGFQLSWRDSTGNRTSSARALVVASADAAKEIESRFSDQVSAPLDEGPGYRTDRWGNMLFRSYDGSYREAPPGEVTALVRRCAEGAAAGQAPDGAEFTDCRSPERTGVFARQFVRDPSVRGASCDEAEELLRRAVEGPTGTCADLGPGWACFTEFYCCDAPTEYAGNGRIELIWDGGF